MKKLPANFIYLRDMYADDYYPRHLVDRLRDTIQEAVSFLESGERTTAEIQAELDRVTQKINDLQAAFEAEESELETVARESIAATIRDILSAFEVDISIEEAIRVRDW